MSMNQKQLARDVLSRPDLFPEEFISWLTRFISNNPRILINKGMTAGGNIGGGGTVTKAHLMMLWEGQNLPPTTGPNNVWVIPKINGSSVSFGMTTLSFSVVTAGTSTYTVKAQYSTNSGATYTDIGSASLTAGNLTVTTTFAAVTLNSGNLVRINWTALGNAANIYTVQLEGDKQ